MLMSRRLAEQDVTVTHSTAEQVWATMFLVVVLLLALCMICACCGIGAQLLGCGSFLTEYLLSCFGTVAKFCTSCCNCGGDTTTTPRAPRPLCLPAPRSGCPLVWCCVPVCEPAPHFSSWFARGPDGGNAAFELLKLGQDKFVGPMTGSFTHYLQVSGRNIILTKIFSQIAQDSSLRSFTTESGTFSSCTSISIAPASASALRFS